MEPEDVMFLTAVEYRRLIEIRDCLKAVYLEGTLDDSLKTRAKKALASYLEVSNVGENDPWVEHVNL